MIVVMQPGATTEQIEAATERLGRFGFDVYKNSGVERVVLAAVGLHPDFDVRAAEAIEGVAEVHRITHGYRLAGRLWKPASTVVHVAGAAFGGPSVPLVAVADARGEPAASARAAREAGAALVGVLHGGAGTPDVAAWTKAAHAEGLGLAFEVTDAADVEAAGVADVLVVAPERMEAPRLLAALGRGTRPVFLYRSPSATVDEWLAAADAVLAGGNPNVVLVEAGLRTFETTTHRTLDLSAVPAVHARSHLPILVDPSRGTGVARKVAAMARAAVAAGADGLVVDLAEPEAMAELMRGVRAVAAAVGRRA